MTVSIICLADRPARLPLFWWALLAQTYTAWELLILDQTDDAGATVHSVAAWEMAVARGHRVDVLPVERVGDWGQSAKERAALEWARGDALLFPNDDAYYVPTALEMLVGALRDGHDLALCGWLYDLLGYVPMPADPTVGRVDVGGFLVRRDLFARTGWPNKGQTGDGELVRGFLEAGARVARLPQTLYVKN